MKKILFSLVVSSLLLLVGCKENSITDPGFPETIKKNDLTIDNTFRGIISIDRILMIPDANNTEYQLKGTISYTDENIIPDSSKIVSIYNVKLGIFVNAILTAKEVNSINHNRWIISSKSEDLVYVSPEGIKILEKSYPVLGRNDGMRMVCTFTITTNGISLDVTELKIPNNKNVH